MGCNFNDSAGHVETWQQKMERLGIRPQAIDLNEPFIAVLGGSETNGKELRAPYPELLGEWLEMPVLNLGVLHAGVSLFSDQVWLLDIASRAKLTILQVMSAQNMSNRLYCVHSRRNDRFLAESAALRHMYPDVDFADVNFTGHLVTLLRSNPGAGFDKVVAELRWAWVERMNRILSAISSNVLLLWMSQRRPTSGEYETFAQEPMFVTSEMLAALSERVAGVTEVVRPVSREADPELPFGCSELDSDLHAAAAEALVGPVSDLLDMHAKAPADWPGLETSKQTALR